MPVSKCESNGKYRIGSGACIYDTKEEAEKVWAAIRAQGKYKSKFVSCIDCNKKYTITLTNNKKPQTLCPHCGIANM